MINKLNLASGELPYCWAVVAQLAEWSLASPEETGSNPVIVYLFQHCLRFG